MFWDFWIYYETKVSTPLIFFKHYIITVSVRIVNKVITYAVFIALELTWFKNAFYTILPWQSELLLIWLTDPFGFHFYSDLAINTSLDMHLLTLSHVYVWTFLMKVCLKKRFEGTKFKQGYFHYMFISEPISKNKKNEKTRKLLLF